MNIVSDFKFQLNKDRIINSVQSYCQSPPYEELSKIYDSLIPLVREYCKPLGLFKIERKPEQLELDLIKNCKFVVYCAVTIGQDSVDKVDSLFDEGMFYEAVLLDAMASSFLFDVSCQLFTKICEKYNDINLGLTNKIVPGDGDIELEYQKEIVSKLKSENIHDISIINDCMLYPAKSMSYIYGADESIAINQYNDHSCATCSNMFCKMRNISVNSEPSFITKTGCA